MPNLIFYQCPKCNKQMGEYKRCPNCDTWPLKNEVKRSTHNEAHDRTYYAMERDHGKAFADKHWKSDK